MKESRAKERNGKQKNTENKRTQEQTATLTKKKKKNWTKNMRENDSSAEQHCGPQPWDHGKQLFVPEIPPKSTIN